MTDKDDDAIDWSLTTYEGSRRGQFRRAGCMSFDDVLDAIEQMHALAAELAGQAWTSTRTPEPLSRESTIVAESRSGYAPGHPPDLPPPGCGRTPAARETEEEPHQGERERGIDKDEEEQGG